MQVTPRAPADKGDWNAFLHDLRSQELRRLPAGADVVLSGGAAGTWYFDWFKSVYPTPVRRHIAVEAFSAKPDDLPAEVDWLSRTLGDLTPVADAEVDLVYAGQTVEHLWAEDVVGFLLEAHRVLKPGATIALDSPNRRITTECRWLQPEHTVEFTVSEITELLDAAGFSDVKARGVWLSYDVRSHRFLPLEVVSDEGEWPSSRRAGGAADRPEDSFIWWVEATKNGGRPDPPRVAELAQQAMDAYRAFRFRQFEHHVGEVERDGDDVVIRSSSGEAGFLLAGPYVPMRPGRWTALFRVGTEHEAMTQPDQPVVRIDITTGLDPVVREERFLTQTDLPGDGRLREIAIPFKLDTTEFGVQLRVESLGLVPVTTRAHAEVEAATRTTEVGLSRAPRAEIQATSLEDAEEQRPPPVNSSTPLPGPTRSSAMLAIARLLLWPMKRFFDPRFGGIAAQITVTHEHVADRLGQANAQLAQTNAQLAQAQSRLDEVEAGFKTFVTSADEQVDVTSEAASVVGESLVDLRAAVEGAVEELRISKREFLGGRARELVDAPVEDLDGDTAALLNYASGHTGFAAQRLLWFNWPVSVSHEAGSVKLTNVNERIVETPFAFRALAGLPEGAKVLDVGATESTVALSLASLGFEVTALDPRPYPLTHPRLETVVADVGSWQTEALFDAVLCLSTLEHIGLGAYGDPRDPEGDRQALDRIRALMVEGGLLLLTVPFGERRVDELERTYDREALEAILVGWSIDDVTLARRRDPVTWELALDGGGGADAVALVIAHR